MLRRCFLRTALFIWLVQPTCVFATQTHGGQEGLFVHQFAHLFFIFSMGLLIYWLRKRLLAFSEGWRHIQYAAFFFIAWNLDAMFSHWLLEQSGLVTVENLDGMQMQITTGPGLDWLAKLYYFTKLDHLLCVPAMFLLLTGLRRLYNSSFPMKDYQEPVS